MSNLFDAVRAATGSKAARYFIFGFSEGGQFVHRLVWLLPEARYARAVIGTPGWYTMPRFDLRYPYGLGGAPVTEANLRTSLARDVVPFVELAFSAEPSFRAPFRILVVPSPGLVQFKA